MEVKQIAELVNETTSEILGETALVTEDLGNIVDIGTAIFNANAMDRYVKALVNRIGRTVFVNRKYVGGVPSLYRDAWEYGSVRMKIRVDMPDAQENETWELETGASYDPNIFYGPEAHAKFFNKKVTFEIPISFAERQVKQSLSGPAELTAFVNCIETQVQNSMTVKTESLEMRTINAAIVETLDAEVPGGVFSGRSGVKAVNLLYLYNQRYPGATISTAAEAITTPEFIRFAAWMIGVYTDRISRISTLFNVGGTEKFTPPDKMHMVLLSDFAKSANVYLQSDTFHNEFTKLPMADTVPYWQGTGTGYAFTDISAIKAKTPTDGTTVEISGVLGVLFDHDAAGVTNEAPRVTSNYNPKAEFYTNWHKFDADYFVDKDENLVVFYAA